MLDTKKVQQRLSDLAATFKAYLELKAKPKTKVTKGDKRRIQEFERELDAILEPEERSNLIVDINTVAAFFSITTRNVQHWVKAGCPKLKHGTYDLKAIFDWWKKNINASGDSQETENVKAEYWYWQKENARLKAQQTSTELVKREEIATAWASRVAEVKAGLMSLVDRLPPLVTGKDRPEVRDIIYQEIWTLCERYARNGKYCD